jgi:GAF domain-containing protein
MGAAVNDQHEQRLARVLVELADTLVDDFDLLEFLSTLVQRCVELLNVTAAGVVLSDQKGGLRMAAASSEQARLVEVLAVQADDGPCLDCVHTGEPVLSPDLAAETARWPRFVPAALEAGFHAASAVPMRLRHNVIGSLNLLHTGPDVVDEARVSLGQALADVATIGLLHERNVRRSETVAEQLQAALNSRVVIEQAKGKLAERLGIDMDRAFKILRDYARTTNQHLTDVARDFVTRGSAEFPPPGRRQPGR